MAARAVVACAVIALVVIGGCASGGGSEEAGEAASPSQLMATLGSKELRHTRMVHSVVYSRDSAYLVSVGDAAVLISDAATGEPVGRIRLRGSGSMKPYDASSERIDLGA
ncbi:MAG: hypothetical protein MI741_10665, partial [Rhodospirillales bacterium]|nr:hypothetical protein [Rhodospirillales bacterium]